MLQRHSRLAFEGSIHFLTTVTSVRGNWFLDAEICQRLLEFFEKYRARYHLDCYGWVLMPDHVHALVVQNCSELVIPSLMKGFKQITSRQCKPPAFPDRPLWHSRYDDVSVPGHDAARTKMEYMHNNPVEGGLVINPEDYLWSSAREYFMDWPGIITLTRFE
jgi:putative transposase